MLLRCILLGGDHRNWFILLRIYMVIHLNNLIFLLKCFFLY
jgi:hypothetical protein